MPLPELFLNSSTPGQIVSLTTLGAAQSSTSSLTFTMNAAAPAALRNTQQGQFTAIIDSEIVLFDATACSTTTWTALQRGYDNSTPATHVINTPVFHDLTKGSLDSYVRPWQNDEGLLQNGVLAAGALALSAQSISTTTGALTFTVAASDGGVIAATPATQPYWVKNASGLLVPVYTPVQTVAALTPGTLPTPGNFLIVGVEMDSTGAISLVSGASSAGSGAPISLSETTVGGAGNTPVVTSGKLRIADIGIENTGGVYKYITVVTLAAPGTTWVDRRPWARGATFRAVGSGAVTNTTANGAIQSFGDTAVRIECTNAPVYLSWHVGAYHSVANDWIRAQAIQDGVVLGQSRELVPPVAGTAGEVNASDGFLFTPAAGSHLFDLGWSTLAATATSPSGRRELNIIELPRVLASNGAS